MLYWILFILFLIWSVAFILSDQLPLLIIISALFAAVLIIFKKPLSKKIRGIFAIYFLAFTVILIPPVLSPGTEQSSDTAFKSYPDFKIQSSASNEELNVFSEAALRRDVQASLQILSPARRTQYETLFQRDLKKLEFLGKALKKRELVYLSDPATVSEENPRMAEYEVIYDNNVFYIRLFLIDGKWLIDIL